MALVFGVRDSDDGDRLPFEGLPELRPERLGEPEARALLNAAVPRRIPRADVAATLAELLHEPRIRRQILELTQGSTPVARAVLANVA